ncbi:MAG: DUF1887 family CARF protein [Eubacteriales bacterium]|nr:DUF1887 family CARF protein [Lachnospiraceae bacterium]MDO5127045.1 DUF1887 family CARF protein [Eubacteriales bacterium]
MERAKVLVEFYSEEPLENVMAMIKYRPEKIVFLGHKDNMITKKIHDIMHFRDCMCTGTELEFIEVPKDDLNGAIELLSGIIRDYPGVRFELTGGSELILIALGCIAARYDISKLRIDPFTGKEIDIRGRKVNTSDYHFNIGIAEDIILHGGVLTNQTASYADWHFTESFREDIRILWDICQKYKKNWNRYCGSIDELQKNAPRSREGWVDISRGPLGDAYYLLQDLLDAGMIKDYSEHGKQITFRFKNNAIRRVIGKAGNILELHVYEVATRDGYLFTDAIIGAHIDWDGEIHDIEHPGYDTINEIDVILMKNVCPIFISCKNGKVGGLALHELETVSRKFGGKYARKALVVGPALDNTTGTMYFRQRAKDMHIWIIDDVFRMSDEQLLNRLKRI